MNIVGRATIWPFLATGLVTTEFIPNNPDCNGRKIGVDIREESTSPLLIQNVPLSNYSTDNFPLYAFLEIYASS